MAATVINNNQTLTQDNEICHLHGHAAVALVGLGKSYALLKLHGCVAFEARVHMHAVAFNAAGEPEHKVVLFPVPCNKTLETPSCGETEGKPV